MVDDFLKVCFCVVCCRKEENAHNTNRSGSRESRGNTKKSVDDYLAGSENETNVGSPLSPAGRGAEQKNSCFAGTQRNCDVNAEQSPSNSRADFPRQQTAVVGGGINQLKGVRSKDLKAVKVLGFAACGYFIAWGPYVISTILSFISKDIQVSNQAQFFFIWLANSNSFMNVFIYSLMYSSYRHKAKVLLFKMFQLCGMGKLWSDPRIQSEYTASVNTWVQAALYSPSCIPPHVHRLKPENKTLNRKTSISSCVECCFSFFNIQWGVQWYLSALIFISHHIHKVFLFCVGFPLFSSIR